MPAYYGRGGAGNYQAAVEADAAITAAYKARAIVAEQQRLAQPTPHATQAVAERPQVRRIDTGIGPSVFPEPPRDPLTRTITTTTTPTVDATTGTTTTTTPPPPTPSSSGSEGVTPTGDWRLSGRGGSGNYWEPASAARPLTARSDSMGNVGGRPSPLQGGHARGISGLFQFRGRGGAGNFDEGAAQEEEQRRLEEERRSRELDISERAFVDVELGLPRPERAFLGGGRQRIGDVDIGIIGVERLAAAIHEE